MHNFVSYRSFPELSWLQRCWHMKKYQYAGIGPRITLSIGRNEWSISLN